MKKFTLREMLPEEIHQSRSPSSSSPASSSSYATVWIPGSSPPAQMWGHSLVVASAIKQIIIYTQCAHEQIKIFWQALLFQKEGHLIVLNVHL